MSRKQENDLLFHIVTKDVQGFVTKFYQWICLLHRIWDFWNRMTVTQLLELTHQFWSCDHQHTPSQDRKYESYLVPSQGCTMDSRHSHQDCCYMAAISQAVCHAADHADGSWHCHDKVQQAANEFQLQMCFCPEISHNIKDIWMRLHF